MMKATGYLCVALILIWACAVDHANAISGGKRVPKTAAYPFVVLVKEGKRMICAGALISPTWVVTSASCVNKKRTSYRFILGENDRTKRDGEQILRARRIVRHPKFKAITKANDIALVALSGRAKIRRRNIGTIGVGFGKITGKRCVVTGWGQSVDDNGVATENRVLQRAVVVRNDSCTVHDDFNPVIHMCYSAMIRVRNDSCTVHDDFGSVISNCYTVMDSQVCQKDAGAPIACKVRGRYRLYSIHRGGESNDVCPQAPFVGTKVAKYYWWMRHVIRTRSELI